MPALWSSIETDFQLADESMKDLTPFLTPITEGTSARALSNREELKSLELASEIYRQKVNVVRADFLPSGFDRQLSGDQPIARQTDLKINSAACGLPESS